MKELKYEEQKEKVLIHHYSFSILRVNDLGGVFDVEQRIPLVHLEIIFAALIYPLLLFSSLL